jgi:hypothetical protein
LGTSLGELVEIEKKQPRRFFYRWKKAQTFNNNTDAVGVNSGKSVCV